MQRWAEGDGKFNRNGKLIAKIKNTGSKNQEWLIKANPSMVDGIVTFEVFWFTPHIVI